MRGHIVEPIGTHSALTKPAQVGNDDFEPSIGKRLNHLPKDSHRLGPTVHAHQRHPTDSLAHEGLTKPSGLCGVHDKTMWIDMC